MSQDPSDAVPEGFVPLPAGGRFLRSIGSLHVRPQPDAPAVLALRITTAHDNMGGVAHGGLLVTLADSAMGMALWTERRARGGSGGQATITLNSDFLDAARPGDWLEAHPRITRMGKRNGFATCELRVGERRVLQASAVFAFFDAKGPAAQDG